MRGRSAHVWLCCALVAGLMACDVDDGGGDPPAEDAGAADGMLGGGDTGGGGEGGEGGQGGQGGEGGEGGQGGEGGNVDGPCADLDEDACDAREDCAAREDVFGDFVDCRDLGDVPCSMLDDADCARRDDCQVDDAGTCSPIPVACADHADEATCADNACHWWDDACHDDPEPAQCDQPDPGSCENAGCMWTDDGCMPIPPTCDEIDDAGRCEARRDCRWTDEGCEIDPGALPCEELDPDACEDRLECTWYEELCVERPMGPCSNLDAAQCDIRVDCEPDPGEADCRTRPIDCAQVPFEACEATPGCALELPEFCDENCNCPPDAECDCIECEPQACVPDAEFVCAQLDPRACAESPDCHVEWEVRCDEGGGGVPPGGGQDGDPEPFQQGGGCEEVPVCVPGDGGGGGVCEEIVDLDQCVQTPGCGLEEECDCGDPPPPPEGCDCPEGAPCPCLVAVPCECQVRCVTEVDACEEIADPEQCERTPGCGVVEVCDCDDGGVGPGVAAPPPPPGVDPCECPPDDPECVCDAPVPPPEPCPCALVCEPIGGGDNCWELDQGACWDNPQCEWIDEAMPGEPEPGIDPVDLPNGQQQGGEMCECFIDDAGNEVCVCDGGGAEPPPPQGGFCADRVPEDRCGGLDEGDCRGQDACEWFEAECPCFVDEQGNEICPDCAGGFCGERWIPGPCEGLGERQCVDAEGCRWENLDGMPAPCDCFIDENGEEICECVEPEPVPGGGFCVEDWDQNPCEGLDIDACGLVDGCRWEGAMDNGRPAPCDCQPGPDGEVICDCDDPIEPVEGWCVQDWGGPDDRCFGMDEQMCADAADCGWFDAGIGMECPPCPPGEPCPPCIAPAPECLPVEMLCGLLDAMTCDTEPMCRVDEIEICVGGGGDPDCPPGEPCEPPPMPNGQQGGECWVEQACVFAGDNGVEPEPMPGDGADGRAP